MTDNKEEPIDGDDDTVDLTEEQRREFLARVAKLAIQAPTIAVLLVTSTEDAHAAVPVSIVPP